MLIEQVAAAPVPPPPVIVIVGGVTYPEPAFKTKIFSIEVTLALVVNIPIALVVSLAGESLNVIVGGDVNPAPSLFKNISLT